jgi:serine/threonine-protein kinase
MNEELEFLATLRDAGIDPDTLVLDDNGTLPLQGDQTRVDGPALPRLGSEELRVLDTLGAGGMAVVERAVQVPLAREVAVKRASPDTTQDLVVEARTTGHLEHPNVVPVYALGRDESGEVLLVMKRIEGRSWRELLEEDADDLDRHLDILTEVCRAVHFAHERGVLHRDLKPDNVMVGPFGEVYVLDWGIAVGLDERAPDAIPKPETLEIVGTPGFMAPEMCEPGAKLSRATDVYELGATLYRVLTGHRAHTPNSTRVVRVLVRTVMSEHADPGAGVPAELRSICLRATAREPEARHPTADALRLDLERYRAFAAVLRIVDEAIARVARLEELDDDPERDGEASRAYHEARFGLEQALRERPELTDARAALERAHLAMARRELRRGRPDVARQAASELAAPPDDLARALERATDERAKLQALADDLDPRRGQRNRAVLVGVVAVVAGGAFTASGWLQYTGSLVVDQWQMLWVNLVGFSVFLIAMIAMRIWRQNRVSRMIGYSASVVWLACIGLVVVGIRFDVSIPASAATVGLIVAVGLAIMATADRRFLLAAVIYALGSAVALLVPEVGLLVAGLTCFVSFAMLAAMLARHPDPS